VTTGYAYADAKRAEDASRTAPATGPRVNLDVMLFPSLAMKRSRCLLPGQLARPSAVCRLPLRDGRMPLKQPPAEFFSLATGGRTQAAAADGPTIVIGDRPSAACRRTVGRAPEKDAERQYAGGTISPIRRTDRLNLLPT